MLQNDTKNKEVDKTNGCHLIFDTKRHCIVNLVSTLTNSQLMDMINDNHSADAPVSLSKIIGNSQVVKAVPLPGVQFLSGLLTVKLIQTGKYMIIYLICIVCL